MKYLSLCLPTNGISKWVFPALDAIFRQNADKEEYEVIVTDNGNNQEFHDIMAEYAHIHDNLIYSRNSAFLFENQIAALRLGTGEYLKFMNHRSILEPGAIQWMIDVIKENRTEKPIMYFSNGVLHYTKRKEYNNFDGFVKGLKHYASWTTGVGVWKSDFEKIPDNHVYNRISPHSDILFAERHRSKYFIDDTVWSHDIDSSHAEKGRYNLYKAFGVEEPAVMLNLFIDGDISSDTLKCVIKSYEKCLAEFYLEFSILHRPCSYDLNGFNDAMGVFMNKKWVILRAYMYVPQIIIDKIYHELKKLIKG